jgi:hypothetical protein
MKFLAWAGVGLVLAAAPLAAEETAINLDGNAWETGGFPASLPGDELQAVGIVNSIQAPLFWSPDIFSYTWYMRGLLSLGETVYGTTRVATYNGGLFTVYVDWKPSNHAYGVYPPNATVPSTFTDGHGVYLGGELSEFYLTYNSATSSGGFVGELLFTHGNAFPQIQSPDGWAVGANISDVSPAGYDLELNGRVYVDGPVAIEAETWGALKALYR